MSEQQKIAQAINGFGQIEPRQQTIHTFSVLSYRNDSVTAHKVNTRDLTCTCEDMEYNNDGSEVCAHVAVALHYSNRTMDVGTALNFNLHERLTELEGIAESIAGGGDSEPAGEDTGEDFKPDHAASDEEKEDDAQEAKEAAERLKEAFDGAIDDMRVQASGGAVFFQTGQDTPDDWPYPGGSETFKVLTSPDVVKYVHDGTADWADNPHPLYDFKPGEWWKNALDPEDVDEYISEVLE